MLSRALEKAVTVALLVMIGLGFHFGRRSFIRSWFGPGEVLRPPAPAAPPQKGPLAPLRVMLIDGLRADEADRLPALTTLCHSGLTLQLDVGFPSVSLPVQHVLWTGSWQLSSGVMFALDQLPRPVFESLPELVTRRSGNAVAIAQAHREIVASFPFSQIIAPLPTKAPLLPLALQQESLSAATSNASLAFFYLTAVDEAGHRFGALSPEYQQAAQHADALLKMLWEIRSPSWTLAVLSDHGHLFGGGHGDVEPEIAQVKACLAGPGLPRGKRAKATLPDLTRIMADQLHLSPPANSVGRPLEQVLAASSSASSAPPSSWSVWSIVLALLLGGAIFFFALNATSNALRPWRSYHLLLLPWGLLLSLLFLVVGWGPPSLSRPYVYPTLSIPLLLAGLPGGLFIGLQCWTLRRSGCAPLPTVGLLASGLVLVALVFLLLTGWPLTQPPLRPWITGWTSAVLALGAVLTMSLALWWTATSSAGLAGRSQ